MQIRDRVFVVTGASSGIGLATAKALAEQGGKAALVARSTATLAEVSAEIPGSLPITADVTDFDAVRAAVDTAHRHFGRIDGLINNAGRSYEASVEEIDPQIFDEIIHLNVLGPIVAIQAVIPQMRAQREGSIVNVNSGTAFMTIPGYSVYSSSKRALVGFGLAARAELANDGIVVSQVYPGVTHTNFGVNRQGKSSTHAVVSDYSKGDTAEYVAGLILQAIEEGEAEYFANDYIRKLAGK